MFDICYCGTQAGYMHEEWCPRPLFRANEAEETAWLEEARVRREAWDAGLEHGRAAASWFFDGNTTEETYRAVFEGMRDGDPAVMDVLPDAPLSGEWSGDPTPADVLEALERTLDDPDADELLTLYEEGFYRGSRDDIYRAAAAGSTEGVV